MAEGDRDRRKVEEVKEAEAKVRGRVVPFHGKFDSDTVAVAGRQEEASISDRR